MEEQILIFRTSVRECTGYQTYRSAVHPMSPNLQMECRYGGLGKSVENRMSGNHPD